MKKILKPIFTSLRLHLISHWRPVAEVRETNRFDDVDFWKNYGNIIAICHTGGLTVI